VAEVPGWYPAVRKNSVRAKTRSYWSFVRVLFKSLNGVLGSKLDGGLGIGLGGGLGGELEGGGL